MRLLASVAICPSCLEGALYSMGKDGVEISKCTHCGKEFEFRTGENEKEGTVEIKELKSS